VPAPAPSLAAATDWPDAHDAALQFLPRPRALLLARTVSAAGRGGAKAHAQACQTRTLGAAQALCGAWAERCQARSVFRCLPRWVAKWMDFWWGYDVIHNYLLTGRFTWYVPSLTSLSGERCDAPWCACAFVVVCCRPHVHPAAAWCAHRLPAALLNPPPPPTHTHTLRRCAVCAGRAGPAAAPLLVRRQLLQQVRCTGARPVLMLPRPGWHAGAAAHARCQRPRHACCCVTRLVTQTQTQTQTQTHTHTHTHAHTHTHNPQACHQLADGPWAAPLASALRPRLPNRP
jgi:hypothetical protein